MTQIKEMMIPRGTAARPGYAMTPKFITIHNTANENAGAGALSHGTYMTTGSGKNVTTSYHYVVDDGLIVRLLPDNEAAWHAGDGSGTKSGNRTSLAIEICENPESDLTKATDNAAELTARLMKDWGIGLSSSTTTGAARTVREKFAQESRIRGISLWQKYRRSAMPLTARR